MEIRFPLMAESNHLIQILRLSQYRLEKFMVPILPLLLSLFINFPLVAPLSYFNPHFMNPKFHLSFHSLRFKNYYLDYGPSYHYMNYHHRFLNQTPHFFIQPAYL